MSPAEAWHGGDGGEGGDGVRGVQHQQAAPAQPGQRRVQRHWRVSQLHGVKNTYTCQSENQYDLKHS